MTSHPRGLALIINNIQFQCEPNRTRLGAEKDSDNLKRLLDQMGFEVIVETNVTKQVGCLF
jgi:hypothetical protein